MDVKTCSKCKRTLPATAEFFCRCRKSPGGLSCWCKDCFRATTQAWLQAHEGYGAAYREAHREDINVRLSAYRKTEQWATWHREYVKTNRQCHNKYVREWRQANPQFRLHHNLLIAIGHAIRAHKRGRGWESIVGYSLDDLVRHLESRFQPGMTWENYGKWHIDHIRPQSSFVFETANDPQFRECWALSNLQPLWAHDNAVKHTK